jgi:4-hydroxythreonine-4-phosphate dehydrogenase
MDHVVERPRVGLTMGDPAGVGPELLLRALADPCVNEQARLVLVGDLGILRKCAEATGQSLPEIPILGLEDLPSDPEEFGNSAVMVNLQRIDLDAFSPAVVSQQCGQASYDFIQAAIDAALVD